MFTGARHKVTARTRMLSADVKQLESLGIEIINGYKAENADIGAECTIVGNTISRGNEELEEILNRKLV